LILLLKKPLRRFFVLIIFIILNIAAFIFLVHGQILRSAFWTIFLLSSAFFWVMRNARLRDFYDRRGILQKLEENTNVLIEELDVKSKKLQGMPAKSEKVSFLFDASQKMFSLENRDEVLDFLVDSCRELFPQADSILLYLLSKDKEALALTRSTKKKNVVIKEKKGDILDSWVLKHNQSLVVDDVTRDFRFDYNRVGSFKDRGARSFIASPLSVGDRMVGAVRAECSVSSAFSMEESRILRSVCDLGAVVLERANLFEKISELAIRDSLTSLFLRDYFFQRFKEEIVRARMKGVNIGIGMLDIDDFKKINDTYGHIVGDLVLRRLARIMLSHVGNSGNLACRFGGEEFMFMIVESTPERLAAVAERILLAVRDVTLTFRRRKVAFTVSLGAAMYPVDGRDAIDVIDKADQRLYHAKHSGKNRVCFNDPAG